MNFKCLSHLSERFDLRDFIILDCAIVVTLCSLCYLQLFVCAFSHCIIAFSNAFENAFHFNMIIFKT